MLNFQKYIVKFIFVNFPDELQDIHSNDLFYINTIAE